MVRLGVLVCIDDVKRDALARVIGAAVDVGLLDPPVPIDDVKRDALARVIGPAAVRVGVLDALEELLPIEDVYRDAAARVMVLDPLDRLAEEGLLERRNDDDPLEDGEDRLGVLDAVR